MLPDVSLVTLFEVLSSMTTEKLDNQPFSIFDYDNEFTHYATFNWQFSQNNSGNTENCFFFQINTYIQEIIVNFTIIQSNSQIGKIIA